MPIRSSTTHRKAAPRQASTECVRGNAGDSSKAQDSSDSHQGRAGSSIGAGSNVGRGEERRQGQLQAAESLRVIITARESAQESTLMLLTMRYRHSVYPAARINPGVLDWRHGTDGHRTYHAACHVSRPSGETGLQRRCVLQVVTVVIGAPQRVQQLSASSTGSLSTYGS